jgi:hypothetical protein
MFITNKIRKFDVFDMARLAEAGRTSNIGISIAGKERMYETAIKTRLVFMVPYNQKFEGSVSV